MIKKILITLNIVVVLTTTITFVGCSKNKTDASAATNKDLAIVDKIEVNRRNLYKVIDKKHHNVIYVYSGNGVDSGVSITAIETSYGAN